ncbi:hypothetical protein HMPREF2898_04250 [Atopobium sp. HMSC064B08]|nr:hypothetical protein HMPREF2898_04250 [Atopobium sp. HMSC064B08]
MLKRKAMDALINWKNNNDGQALLVSGARQVGKTYLIEQFIHENYEHVVKFDLVDQVDVKKALDVASNSQELFMALSAYAGSEMVPGKTVIFIDEVQECKEALTLVKYLVQRKGFDYILSGSLLGVELRDMRSAPVGYLHVLDMYPLDFEEFCWANGLGDDAWAEAFTSYSEKRPVFLAVHKRLITLFHWYLVTGGMPQAVDAFTSSQNISLVRERQEDILRLYRYDISKYAEQGRRLAIREIYDQMPAQLDSQSKRFNFSTIAPKGTYERYKDDFLWLIDAGVAIPVRNVREPKRPLRLVEDRSFFKLFMNDVGLLTAACGIESVRNILANDVDVNYGSIYENVVAQELSAHGSSVRFFRNRKQGELDFVIEYGEKIVPIEVKSGKNYKRHSALNNVLDVKNYGIDQAIVLCEDNVSVAGKIVYLPIYMVAFIGV